jgi:hypothetical protein
MLCSDNSVYLNNKCSSFVSTIRMVYKTALFKQIFMKLYISSDHDFGACNLILCLIKRVIKLIRMYNFLIGSKFG